MSSTQNDALQPPRKSSIQPTTPQPPNNNNTSNNVTTIRPDRICMACKTKISGQFVKTAKGAYHLDCFRCVDCHQIVASKFFTLDPSSTTLPSSTTPQSVTPSASNDSLASPITTTAPSLPLIPSSPSSPPPLILCEIDYFKRLDLLCFKCGQPLRGPHVKALNRKYHLEHFTCSVCPTVFGVSDTYYERDDQVYCAYHFAVLFASRCGGCGAAVLKNFVEVTRKSNKSKKVGEEGASTSIAATTTTTTSNTNSNEITKKTECWHPECYMIYKLWNVRLSSLKSVHAAATLQYPSSSSSSSNAAATSMSNSSSSSSLAGIVAVGSGASGSVNMSRTTHSSDFTDIYDKACRIFQVLSAFEESAAECMTDMLIHFSNQQYFEGVVQASKFIAHIDVLFSSIDDIENALLPFHDQIGLSHTKEPKQLAKKIVHFFSLLSHSREMGHHSPRGETTKDLISLVTGLAHALKTLIRASLNGALKLEKNYGSGTAINAFLNKLTSLGTTSPSLPTRIRITDIKTDLCPNCRKSVEEACIKYTQSGNLRWHTACFQCRGCQVDLTNSMSSTICDGSSIFCNKCAAERALIPGTSNSHGVVIGVGMFERVSQLEQYVFLLRCALKRLCGLLGVKMDQWNHSVTESQLVSTRIQKIHQDGNASSTSSTANLNVRSTASTTPSLETSLAKLSVNKSVPSLAVERLPSAGSVSALTSEYLDVSNIVSRDRVSRKGSRNKAISFSGGTVDSEILNLNQLAQLSQQVANAMDGQGKSLNEVANVGGCEPPYRHFGTPVGVASPMSVLSTDSKQSPNVIGRGTSPLLQTQMISSPLSNSGSGDGSVVISARQDSLSPGTESSSPSNTIQSQQQQQLYSFPGYERFAQANAASAHALDAHYQQQSVPSPHFHSHQYPSPHHHLHHHLNHHHRHLHHRKSKTRHTDTRYLSELSALEHFIVRQMAVVCLHPLLEEYYSLDELMELVEMRKLSIWEKVVQSLKGGSKKSSSSSSSSNKAKDGTFGIPVEILAERYGVNTDLGESPGQLRVPVFIDKIVHALLHKSDLDAEGIFRKNGNIRRLKAVAEIVDKDPGFVNFARSDTGLYYEDDESDEGEKSGEGKEVTNTAGMENLDNSIQIAALLKKFLREMPEPLLTYKLHTLFCASQKLPNPEHRKQALHLLTCLLPKPNRDTLEVLIHLLVVVAQHSSQNKMTPENLATVITPNILSAKSKNPMDDQSPLAISAVKGLLEWHEEFLEVPVEVWQKVRQWDNINNNNNNNQQMTSSSSSSLLEVEKEKEKEEWTKIETLKRKMKKSHSEGVDG